MKADSQHGRVASLSPHTRCPPILGLMSTLLDWEESLPSWRTARRRALDYSVTERSASRLRRVLALKVPALALSAATGQTRRDGGEETRRKSLGSEPNQSSADPESLS